MMIGIVLSLSFFDTHMHTHSFKFGVRYEFIEENKAEKLYEFASKIIKWVDLVTHT